MKTIFIILICLYTHSIFALDTTPYCRIVHDDGIYSGVVLQNDEDNIYVLTCAHGPNSPLQVQFLLNGYDGFIGIPGKFVHKDIDRDLALIKVPKIVDINPSILSLAQDIPSKDSQMTISGFAKGGTKLAINHVTFLSSTNSMGLNGEFLFEARGNSSIGMSGGPWIMNDQIISIQSTSNSTISIGSSSEQIRTFLNTENVLSSFKLRKVKHND